MPLQFQLYVLSLTIVMNTDGRAERKNTIFEELPSGMLYVQKSTRLHPASGNVQKILKDSYVNEGMGGLAEMTQCEAYHATNPAFGSACDLSSDSYVNEGMGGLAEMTQCEAYHATNSAIGSTCDLSSDSYVNEGMSGLAETKTARHKSQPLKTDLANSIYSDHNKSEKLASVNVPELTTDGTI